MNILPQLNDFIRLFALLGLPIVSIAFIGAFIFTVAVVQRMLGKINDFSLRKWGDFWDLCCYAMGLIYGIWFGLIISFVQVALQLSNSYLMTILCSVVMGIYIVKIKPRLTIEKEWDFIDKTFVVVFATILIATPFMSSFSGDYAYMAFVQHLVLKPF